MKWKHAPLALALAIPSIVAAACSAGSDGQTTANTGGFGPSSTQEGTGGSIPSPTSTVSGFGGGLQTVTTATGIDPDAACATATETAKVEFKPVDIIWVIDNSGSMASSIQQVTAGLNDFVNLIGSKNLDYKVIMLSLRAQGQVTLHGGTRYGVCVPEPLAGDANCGNGPHFFQSSIDMKSTQPLEQFLGTLGQTSPYLPTDERGGEPWKDQLRPEATKTIVVVTDDNSRLTASQFEHFAGGANPGNPTYTLPPGILDASWGGLFDGYTFTGIYGFDDANPSQACEYPDHTMAAASGDVYSDLVDNTMGVRASICDGASAWGPFFDSIATAVETTAKLSCELPIPTPSTGMLEKDKLNVDIVDGAMMHTPLGKVTGASACDATGGWYYDDEANPTQVILCPASCDLAQTVVSSSGNGSIEVLFGCKTIIH